METTGKAFVEHWDWASRRGLMNSNTAASYRRAAVHILSVEDDWENIDISQIDVEQLLRRFENLKGRNFTPESVATYKRKFRQAVESYLAYVRDPSAWKPIASEATRRKEQNGKAKKERTTNTQGKEEPDSSLPDTGISTDEAGWVEYPFPLKDGRVARLRLPTDLKLGEVKRLNAFMMTLAVDYDPT
ncbi:MAG: hypothetical protein RMK84_17630 [Oscillochloridaceae bacterium]|nr:hypothetical protein [Chloroflexaceae bacterium]MDW8391945.1 hypothetical protein [Oscillochloridaceae bacterium]